MKRLENLFGAEFIRCSSQVVIVVPLKSVVFAFTIVTTMAGRFQNVNFV